MSKKKIKSESFKLWVSIEKTTVFEDGVEEYEDIKMEDAYPLSDTGEIKTLDQAYERASQISIEIIGH